MTVAPHSYRVGNATITRIQEMVLDSMSASQLYAGIDQAVADESSKQWPDSMDQSGTRLRLGFHAWLVETPTQTVLIDTGAGAGKERPSLPMFGHLHEPFLARLRAAGSSPEDIDVVLFSHLHVDHVGWNTHKIGDEWVPTFPNARHMFSAREHAYVRSIYEKDGADKGLRANAALGPMYALPAVDFYKDSLLPVINAGLVTEIDVNGTEALEGFTFHPTPGHSIDHASISFLSEGEHAFFWGDVIHHPLQFDLPTWNSVFCEFPESAVRARAWAVSHAAQSGALVFATHLAETSVGRVHKESEALRWKFV